MRPAATFPKTFDGILNLTFERKLKMIFEGKDK
ncbi:hypothetical protein Tco_0270073, partial [Tanacetum coccineum]